MRQNRCMLNRFGRVATGALCEHPMQSRCRGVLSPQLRHRAYFSGVCKLEGIIQGRPPSMAHQVDPNDCGSGCGQLHARMDNPAVVWLMHNFMDFARCKLSQSQSQRL